MKCAPKCFLILIGLCFINLRSAAQTDSSYIKEHFSYRGYLKDLRAVSIDANGNTFNQDWLHNRMNIRYGINNHFTAKLELRNRLFYGEIMKTNPALADGLDFDPGSVDLSFNLLDNKSTVLNTFVDRLWLDYSDDKWEVRLGRQRINWGQNLVWNPNDLFNVLNYTDFDYEERPGSDAFRIQRYFENFSSVQLAYKHSDSLEGTVIAGMYRFNKKTYDIQVILGKYLNDAALGLGWAGNLKNASFKGEMTYFMPIDEGSETFLASLSLDGSVGDNWYITGSTLFNSQGTNDPDKLATLSTNNSTLSVKNLMPNQYSAFLSGARQLGDLVSLNLAGIYAVDLNGVFLMPSLSYSIRDDIDLSLVVQSFVVKLDKFENPGNTIFLRFKWSH